MADQLDANKDLIRRMYAVLHGGGDLDAAATIIAEDYLDHDLPGVGEGGRDALFALVGGVRAAVPDVRPTVVDAVAEGDRVAARVVAEGIHTGAPFPPGIPASGARLRWQECHIYRVANGKVAEHWGVNDMLAILQQLGAAPGPA